MQLERKQVTTRLKGMRMAFDTFEEGPLMIANQVSNLVGLKCYSEWSENVPRGHDRWKYSRLGGRSGNTSFSPELEHDLLQGRGLVEVENNIATEQCRVDVDASAAQTEDIRGDLNVKGGIML